MVIFCVYPLATSRLSRVSCRRRQRVKKEAPRVMVILLVARARSSFRSGFGELDLDGLDGWTKQNATCSSSIAVFCS